MRTNILRVIQSVQLPSRQDEPAWPDDSEAG